jgi:drug/metabolite transporter (DMT)-like permease
LIHEISGFNPLALVEDSAVMSKPHLESHVLGPLLMLSAALQFAVMNFTIKLMGPFFSAWHIAFYRFFGSVVVLLAIFGRSGNPYRGHNYKLLMLRGLTGSVAFLSIVAAICLLPLSTAMVIVYTYPAFAAFFAVWLYGDRIRLTEGGCILVVIVGAWMLFEFKASGRPLGEFLALTGAILFGFTVTLIRSLRQHNGPVIIYLSRAILRLS